MSNNLSPKIRELIAIGASYAANCQPWLATHYEAARRVGATENEIKEAVDLGNLVKQTVANNTRLFFEDFNREFESGRLETTSNCNTGGWKI